MTALNKILKNLDSLTMYKAILFSLIFLFLSALILSLIGLTFFKPTALILSLITLSTITVTSNFALSKLYKVIPNPESALITSLILLFLFSPATTKAEVFTLIIAGLIASASKFLININKVHIFNPAAIAAVITPLLGFDGAIWWVATPVLIPGTLLVGIYLIKKLRRGELVGSYVGGLLLGLFITKQLNLNNLSTLIPEILTSWPIIFFASIMLTEPLTMPNQNKIINLFGLLVGFLSANQYHFGPLFSSPELSLAFGNLFAFILSTKKRYTLTLTKKELVANNTYQLSFTSIPPINFQPGQYLEWSLPHQNADIRAFRRYFTISSSPTEKEIQVTFKVFPVSSSFKNSLHKFKVGDKISASHIAGDFTPDNGTNNMVFIAGGIGVTPFRSIIKYYQDKNINKNIHLLYACTNDDDFAFQSFFEETKKHLNLNTQYFISSKEQKIASDTIKKIKDYQNYTYFISGPDAMVKHYKNLLQSLGIKNIKTDYFPGF